jgi:hypothetical protein
MYDGGFGDVLVTDACGALQGADDMAKKRMFFNMLKHENAGSRRQLKAGELIPMSNTLPCVPFPNYSLGQATTSDAF